MLADDEVYIEILNDYRRGRLTADEAAQEMLDTMKSRNEPLNIQVSEDIKPVLEALGYLLRGQPPSGSE